MARPQDARPGRTTTVELGPGFYPEPEDADPERAAFSIRDLTREFAITARTLRFYEEKELIAPRRVGQDRVYSRRDRARLKLVLMGKSVGFSLDEIRSMLDLYDLGDGQTTQLKVARTRFVEQIERLEEQRRHIDRAIAELKRASTHIDAKLGLSGAAQSGRR